MAERYTTGEKMVSNWTAAKPPHQVVCRKLAVPYQSSFDSTKWFDELHPSKY